jgi:hypothetical protein
MAPTTETPLSTAGTAGIELSELVLEPVGPKRLLHSLAYQGWIRFVTRVLRVGVEVGLALATDALMAHRLSRSQILWDEPGDMPATSAGRRIALYAHYSASGRISSMVCKQLAAYHSHGFDVVFVTNSETVDEESWRAAASHCWHLVRRRNVGFDFGAWRDSAALLLHGKHPEELLLVNDSIVGPIRPLAPLFACARTIRVGAVGMTESRQGGVHLQSYFVLALGPAATTDTLEFLSRLRLSTGKWLIVQRGEFGLTRFLVGRGHRVAALFGYVRALDTILACSEERRFLFKSHPQLARSIGSAASVRESLLRWPVNPSVHLWRGLARSLGFPFVKTALLNLNSGTPAGSVDWAACIGGGVKDDFADLLSRHLETLRLGH